MVGKTEKGIMMMQSKLLSNIIFCSILMLLIFTASCAAADIENGQTNNDEINSDYTIGFRNSSSITNWSLKDKISFNLIELYNMPDKTIEKVANESIENAMTSWIGGKVLLASSIDLFIHCHTSSYLSFKNTFEYSSGRLTYLEDYITIDVKTGKRVMLNDLVVINREFVEHIQKNNLAIGSGRAEQYDSIAENIWDYLNKFTSDDLLNEIKECSKTQDVIIQEAVYTIDESIGRFLFRNSFYLQSNKLILVLEGNIHITFYLDDIEDFLKVEKW